MDIVALLSDPATWLALLTLIALEVVLGVDNLISSPSCRTSCRSTSNSARGGSAWRWR